MAGKEDGGPGNGHDRLHGAGRVGGLWAVPDAVRECTCTDTGTSAPGREQKVQSLRAHAESF